MNDINEENEQDYLDILGDVYLDEGYCGDHND